MALVWCICHEGLTKAYMYDAVRIVGIVHMFVCAAHTCICNLHCVVVPVVYMRL